MTALRSTAGSSCARASGARLRFALLLVLTVAIVPPPGGEAEAPPHDPPLVDPDLASMAEPVRRGIEAYRKLVDELDAAEASADGAAPSRLAQAYGQLGQLYHAHGQTEAALAAYSNARRLEPRAQRWAYYLGILEQSAGSLDAARRDLEAALEAGARRSPTLLRLGELALVQRRLDPPSVCFVASSSRSRTRRRRGSGSGRWPPNAATRLRRSRPSSACSRFSPRPASLTTLLQSPIATAAMPSARRSTWRCAARER